MATTSKDAPHTNKVLGKPRRRDHHTKLKSQKAKGKRGAKK